MRAPNPWILAAFAAGIGVGWVTSNLILRAGSDHSLRVRGAAGKFGAITVHTNEAHITSLFRAGTGEDLWAEWDLNNDGKPDSTTFLHQGRHIATVYTPPDTSPGFDFNFYGEDGKLRTLWMAKPGSKTWTDRITYGTGQAKLERFVNAGWEQVVERNGKRGIIINGDWLCLIYTNGAWATLPVGRIDDEALNSPGNSHL